MVIRWRGIAGGRPRQAGSTRQQTGASTQRVKSEGQPGQKGFYLREGRRLYAERWRSGQPAGQTVVLEVGSLTPGTQDAGWRPIREAIGAELDFFVYDRAGLGQSESVPLPRALADFAADLRAVLR